MKLSPALDRIPPQAIDAEQTVLGCLTLPLDDQAERIRLARERLSRSDFFRDGHAEIFDAVLKVAEAGPVDLMLVAQELERAGHLDHAGGRAYLIHCESMVAAPATLVRHIVAVRRAAAQRRAIEIGGEIISMGFDRADPSTIAAALHSYAGEPRLIAEAGEQLATVTAAELKDRVYDPIRWAIPDLVPEGLTLLSGRSKIGKSILVHGFAAGVAEGGMVLGKVPVESGTVVYCALEDPERRLQTRQRQIAPEGSWPERLHFATRAPTMADGLLGVIAEFRERHPDLRLVILDTWARAKGRMTTAEAKMNAYYQEYETLAALQSFALDHHIAVLCTHHDNKGKNHTDDFDAISGSTGMQAPCDAMVVIRRRRDESTAELVVTGREIEDARLAVHWEGGGGWLLMGKSEEYFRSAEELDVLLALATADAPQTPEEVAADAKLERKAANMRLCRMRDRGLVKQTAKGYLATDTGLRSLKVAGIHPNGKE